MASALDQFHPLIADWFRSSVGRPTAVQQAAWPVAAAGEHVLAAAPTGGGKTMAAFLWAINQLYKRVWSPGRTSVVYVSPLKALNNDVQRNLTGPLDQLGRIFREAGREPPPVRVMTRSGDTPQNERRRMIGHPPEILITTPESLNLLLSSQGGRSILGGVQTVILDEIHSVIGTKRGVFLITAVDRLVRLSGEFQRIALSATIRPLETAAEFVGGRIMTGPARAPAYRPRPVRIVAPDQAAGGPAKEYEVRVRYPREEVASAGAEAVWKPITAELKKIIGQNRSTLVFANSRRMVEKLTLKINRNEDAPLAYAHHGSLSREIRTAVEEKLKAGELRAITATNSLELGIDIGVLDETVLIQAPPTVSAAIQRIGRAGHRVGAISRGTFFPTHHQDLLEAAVLARAVLDRDIEPVRPIVAPLDVLAQVLVSMVGMETWDIDQLYDFIKTSSPYRDLTRIRFDLVINMLAGRYSETRIRELKPRIAVDRLDNTVRARRGALLAVYLSGGVIPDRGYYQLRHGSDNTLIGELDEEFVWEASIGQTFTLGTQSWRIERITHNDVFVRPAGPKAAAAPFWRADLIGRDAHFSRLISRFIDRAEEELPGGRFREALEAEYQLEPAAAEELIRFLEEQRRHTNGSLPNQNNLVIEHVASGPGGAPGSQVIIHTLWGGRVNRPLALALEAAWQEKHGARLEIFPGDDCIVLLLPQDVPGEELLSLVTRARLAELLAARLEGSGLFGANFRECAGRALLLPRPKPGKRVPLWMSRLKSQKLLSAVQPFGDFPILLETWRTCLQDHFDLPALEQALTDLESGATQWREAYTDRPSPMARAMTWRLINQYMYQSDDPPGDGVSRLQGDLLKEVVFDPNLRPALDPAVVEAYRLKRLRLHPGYSPADGLELVEWVKERLLIPWPEWRELLAAMERDHGLTEADLAVQAAGKLALIRPDLPVGPIVFAKEEAGRLLSGLLFPHSQWSDLFDQSRIVIDRIDPDFDPAVRDPILAEDLAQWLTYYGPVSPDWIIESLGIHPQELDALLTLLLDAKTIISGRLIAGRDEDLVCDADNFESLLRLARSLARPVMEPRPLEELPLLLAWRQGLLEPGGQADVFDRLARLSCLPLKAGLWEGEVLPARLGGYQPAWLDDLFLSGDLVWLGFGPEIITLAPVEEADLVGSGLSQDQLRDRAKTDRAKTDRAKADQSLADLFPDPAGRYDFGTLLRRARSDPARLADRLWQAAWQGLATTDAFAPVRQGAANRFKPPRTNRPGPVRPGRRPRLSRSSQQKWANALPFGGTWRLVPPIKASDDPLEREELNKDRIRLLLDRYGLLCRAVLTRENELFTWSALFRTLRLMELSGEVLAGQFFEGLPGPQFISHQTLRRLQRGLPDNILWWVNAHDPASPAGLDGTRLKADAPRRLETTHLVYRGAEPVLVSEGLGKRLTILRLPGRSGRGGHVCSAEPSPYPAAQAAAGNKGRDDKRPTGPGQPLFGPVDESL